MAGQNGWCDSDSLDEVHIIWCTEDVLGQAKEMKVKLSKTVARKILHDLKRHHDADYGISWDSIRTLIRDSRPTTKPKNLWPKNLWR